MVNVDNYGDNNTNYNNDDRHDINSNCSTNSSLENNFNNSLINNNNNRYNNNISINAPTYLNEIQQQQHNVIHNGPYPLMVDHTLTPIIPNNGININSVKSISYNNHKQCGQCIDLLQENDHLYLTDYSII